MQINSRCCKLFITEWFRNLGKRQDQNLEKKH